MSFSALALYGLPVLPALPFHLDASLVIAGALVGLLVGLTGMGGGALLTPLLVLVFGVPPLTAVSSDLVTSLVMKPFGGAVHLAHGTVNKKLLVWLMAGSVPAAFLGSVAIGLLAHGADAARVQDIIKVVIALALLGSVTATLFRLGRVRMKGATSTGPVVVRPAITVLVGIIGGLAVGLSSVGAGTLVIAMLLLLYPQLTNRELVGTDIVQAIPLVASAALGHMLFGDVQMPLTVSLLLGAIPAVIVGARFSSAAPTRLSRPITSAILLGSALALLKAPGPVLVGGALVVAVVVLALGWREPTAEPAR